MSMEDVVLVATVREEIRDGKLNPPVGSKVYGDMQTMVATSPSRPKQRTMWEGDTDESDVECSSKEVPMESPGVEQPRIVESTLQDALKKSVGTPAVQTGGSRQLKDMSPSAVEARRTLIVAKGVEAMAKYEAEIKAKAETAAAAKFKAEADALIAKLEAETKAKAEAEAKAEALEAQKSKLEAEAKANAEATARAEAREKVRQAKRKATAEAKAKREAEAEAKAEAETREGDAVAKVLEHSPE